MAFKHKQKKERLTNKRLNFLIKDEKKASTEYKRLGFTKLAKDENSHQKFLEGIKKKRETKKDNDDDVMGVVNDVYDIGGEVAQRSNPFSMLGKGMGYSDEKQEKIYRNKIKNKPKNKRKKIKKK